MNCDVFLTVEVPVEEGCYFVLFGPLPWARVIVSVQSKPALVLVELPDFRLISDCDQIIVFLPAERLGSSPCLHVIVVRKRSLSEARQLCTGKMGGE